MTITTLLNLDTGMTTLQATSHGHTSIAGPRILRGGPHPSIKFGEYETEEAAEIDAVKLRAYLAENKRGPSKAKQRRAQE